MMSIYKAMLNSYGKKLHEGEMVSQTQSRIDD